MLIKTAFAAGLETYYQPAAAMGGQSANIGKLLTPLIANVFIISGLFAFFVIIFAGFTYITGAGDKNKMTQATNMLTYSILGLVIIGAAYLITRIIGKLLGFDFF